MKAQESLIVMKKIITEIKKKKKNPVRRTQDLLAKNLPVTSQWNRLYP